MKEDEESLTPEERLQQENNFLKLKLMAEHRAKFPEKEDNLMNPQLENAWLHYIYNFEELHKNVGKITIYKRLGKPEFKPADELSDENLEKELNRLFSIMNQNKIALDCVFEYEPRVIYKFITEELFQYATPDIEVEIEGMFSHFIYEEFHPNHDDDLRRYTDEFIEALLQRQWQEYDANMLCRNMTDIEGKEISQEVMIERICLFQESWKKFNILKQEITNVCFDEMKGKASVEMLLAYDAVCKESTTNFSGTANVDFEYPHGYWYIKKVAIPGFNI